MSRPPDAFTVLCAFGAGVRASVVPYLAGLVAPRRVPANVFGIVMANAGALLFRGAAAADPANLSIIEMSRSLPRPLPAGLGKAPDRS